MSKHPPLQKSPVWKWAEDITRHFSKTIYRWSTDTGKNAPQNYNEISCHTCQNGYTPRHKKQVFARMWKQRKPLALLVEMQMGAAPLENSMEIPHKTKKRTLLWSSYCPIGYYPKNTKNMNSMGHTYPCVYCSIISNSQRKHPLTNEWTQNFYMYVSVCVYVFHTHTHTHTHKHTHPGILLNHKTRKSCHLLGKDVIRMEPESSMLRKVRERQIPYDFTHVAFKKQQMSKGRKKKGETNQEIGS